MNDRDDDARVEPARDEADKATGIKMLVLVFGLPLILVLLVQFLVF